MVPITSLGTKISPRDGKNNTKKRVTPPGGGASFVKYGLVTRLNSAGRGQMKKNDEGFD